MCQVKDFLLTIFSCVVWYKGIYFVNFSNKNIYLSSMFIWRICLYKNFSIFLCIFHNYLHMYLLNNKYINVFQCIYYPKSFIFQLSIYKDTCK
jgi:hypothetical protein